MGEPRYRVGDIVTLPEHVHGETRGVVIASGKTWRDGHMEAKVRTPLGIELWWKESDLELLYREGLTDV